MFARRVLPLAVAGATLAAGLGYAVPAAASVRYDPQTKSGLADAADVRRAFGWSEAVLAARADRLVFHHDFWTEDTYSVSCGKASFRVRHAREFGRLELSDRVVREPRRGTSIGYDHRFRLVGFRIIGPHAGVSGTSVPPAVGQPCPQPDGSRITRADLVATVSGWSLNAGFAGVNRVLRSGRPSGV
ncbi:hypothetical protein [Couchioplanes azureus]|uniref:hypothetical protein n=1 Tax=Couchioplanes caeruleus TaxID=56438 RepID=UPI00166F82E5|nr:hypothetical protein [Couchioplanes caeruleus]GGQ54664.1 hypothetical protein GCM10010166_24540 [Couchioplanes caeruleus subsp. azureus]